MDTGEIKLNEHEGHRERIRKRASDGGLMDMPPHEVMELILYFALPRRDVNELAHRLIDTFGSVRNVLTAGVYELADVKGVGENTARMLKAFGKSALSYIGIPDDIDPKVFTRSNAIAYASSLFENDRRAQTWVALVNSGGGISYVRRMFTGARWYTEAVRKFIIERVLMYDAHEVIVISRRGMDLPRPFESDLYSLNELSDALKAVDAYILDFIIVGLNKNVSMRQVADIGKSRYESREKEKFLNEMWLSDPGDCEEITPDAVK